MDKTKTIIRYFWTLKGEEMKKREYKNHTSGTLFAKIDKDLQWAKREKHTVEWIVEIKQNGEIHQILVIDKS